MPNATHTQSLVLCDGPSMLLDDALPLFRSLGYTCTYATTVDSLASPESTPAALLFSADLPGGAHGKGLATIRQLFPTTPLIAVAQLRSFSAVLEYFRAGITDYWTHPLNQRDVEDRLAAIHAANAAGETSSTHASPEASDETSAEHTPPPDADHTPADSLTDARGQSLAADAMPCGILILDGKSLLQYANDLALSLLAEPSVESLRETLASKLDSLAPLDVHEKPLHPTQWPLTRACKEKTPQTTLLGLQRPGNKRIWLQCNVKPELVKGKIRQIVVTLTNQTDYMAALRTEREKAAK